MFYCDKCGLCCRNVNNSEIYKDLDRGDGVCKYLNEITNLCKVYDERPLICNVDKMYDTYFSEKINRDEYYTLNYKACNELKEGKRNVFNITEL